MWLPVKRDFYWYIGRYSIIVFLARVWTRMLLRRFALAWLVKLFFLPIMIGSLSYSVDWFLSHRFELAFASFYTFFDYYWELILAVDVVLAIVGYIFSMRLLGTEVVATDETWRGWVATLICYYPFSNVLYGSYLTYEEGYRWGDALAGTYIPYIMYGLTVLFFHTLYLDGVAEFRHPLFQPQPSRHPHRRPVPLHQASGLSVQEHRLVDGRHSVHHQWKLDRRRAQLRHPAVRERGLLVAGAHRGIQSVARPGLCRLCAVDERAQHLPLRGAPRAGSGLPPAEVPGSLSADRHAHIERMQGLQPLPGWPSTWLSDSS